MVNAIAGPGLSSRYGIALAFAGFAFMGVNAGATGVLLPAQISDYHIDKTVVGALFITFSIGYVTSSTAIGWLLRRLGSPGQLTLGSGLILGGCLVIAARPAFVALVALQLVLGFGMGILDAGLNSYVTHLPGRVALLNYLHAFFGVGALLGPPIAAAMLHWHQPWQRVYLLFAALAAALVAGFALVLPRVKAAVTQSVARVALPADDSDAGVVDATAPSQLGAAVRRRAVWLGGLFLCLYVGIEVSLGNWGYTFLVEDRGQSTLVASWVVSGYWLGLTAGRFLLNNLAERAGAGPIGLMVGSLVGIAAGDLLTWLAPSASAVGLVVTGFFLGPVFPTTIAIVPRMAPRSVVPSAIGLLVGLSVVGGAVFPWIAGALAQRLGAWSLLPFTLALAVLLAANWWRIVRRLSPA